MSLSIAVDVLCTWTAPATRTAKGEVKPVTQLEGIKGEGVNLMALCGPTSVCPVCSHAIDW